MNHRIACRSSLRPAAAPLLAGLACLITPAAQAGDLTAALNAAPAGAEFVMVIPSMQDASDAVADLAESFQIDEPEMLDLLGSFKQEMGITAGLNNDGAAVIVMSGLGQAIANDEEPEPLVLLPVSDYAAFVESIGGTAGGITGVTLEGDDGFAKQVGDFALLGEDRAAVEAYASGDAAAALMQRVGKYGNDGADDALIAGFIDVAAMRPALTKQLDEAMAEVKQELAEEARIQTDLPIEAESMANLAEAYGDLGRLVLEGVDAAMFTATSDTDGIRGGYAWNVVEGSQLATYFTGERADFAGLLAQMPADPYLFAVALDTTAMDFGGMSSDLLDAVGEAMGDEPMFAGVMELVKESLVVYQQMNAGAQVFYAPDMAAMMGGGMMKTLSVYDVDDTDAAIEAWRNSMAKMPGMIPDMLAELGEDAPEAGMDFTFEWNESALNLGDTDVHQYELKMILPPELMGELGPAAMMLGNAGTSGYVAAVDGKLVMTTVPDPQLMTKGLESLKAGDGLGAAPTVADSREQLPDGAVMGMFVSLDGMAEAANPFLMMFAGGMQLDVPEDLSPIAMGVGLDGTAMGAEVVVPSAVLDFIRDTIEKTTALTNQGQGSGSRRAPY